MLYGQVKSKLTLILVLVPLNRVFLVPFENMKVIPLPQELMVTV